MKLLDKIYNETYDGTLYHYTSQEGLIGIFESKNIWASRVQYLNDEEEFKYALNLLIYKLQDKYLGYGDGVYDYEQDLSSFLEVLELAKKSNIFVCSFSEIPDQLSQWRGYTSVGKGYSIGFEYKNLAKRLNQNNRIFKLVRCIYDEDEQGKLIQEFVDNNDIPRNINIEDPRTQREILNILNKFVEIAPILKHPTFKEEQEWRLISPLINSFVENVKVRTGKSMIIPYIEFSLADDHNDIEYDEIIIGPTPNPKLSKTSTELFIMSKSVNKKREIKVLESKIPYRDW